MIKIEEVKIILKKLVEKQRWYTGGFKPGIDKEAREICQLFFKSPDNPDGYEPPETLKSLFARAKKRPDLVFPPEYYDDEPKSEETREGICDNCHFFVSQCICKPKPNDRLLTAEEIHKNLMKLPSCYWVIAHEKHLAKYGRLVAKAQRDMTASILEAKCEACDYSYFREGGIKGIKLMACKILGKMVIPVQICYKPEKWWKKEIKGR